MIPWALILDRISNILLILQLMFNILIVLAEIEIFG